MGAGGSYFRHALGLSILASALCSSACNSRPSGGEPVTRDSFRASWVPAQELHAPVVRELAHFGMAVAMDADRIFVGTPSDDNEAHLPVWGDVGSVNIYVRNGAAWTLEQQLYSTWSAKFFGKEVRISGDTLAVGRWD